MRAKLSPAFTSGKLKAIFSTLIGFGPTLQNHLEKLYDNGELLDICDVAYGHGINVSVPSRDCYAEKEKTVRSPLLKPTILYYSSFKLNQMPHIRVIVVFLLR